MRGSTGARHPRRAWHAALPLALLALLLAAAPAGARAADPGIAPPGSRPAGKSYGEWAAAWWQWFASIEADRHPLNDESTADCSVGQTGQVWFLGGTAGGPPVMRTCTVPSGTALLVSPFAGECSEVEGDGETDAELRACAKELNDATTEVRVTLDGRAVQDVRQYRVQSPLFTLDLVEDNLFGLPAGPTPSVADGYWLFIEPLPVGKHTLTMRGVNVLPGEEAFVSDVTYAITVAQPGMPRTGGGGGMAGSSAPPAVGLGLAALLGAGLVLGYRRARRRVRTSHRC